MAQFGLGDLDHLELNHHVIYDVSQPSKIVFHKQDVGE
jgi:hypothetical protein